MNGKLAVREERTLILELNRSYFSDLTKGGTLTAGRILNIKLWTQSSWRRKHQGTLLAPSQNHGLILEPAIPNFLLWSKRSRSG